jgi:hypothetical protein
MSGKAKTNPVDKAVAVIRRPKRSDADIVALTHTISDAAETSPDWSAAVDVQSAVAAWKQAADTIDAQAKMVAGLREQLKGAGSKLLSLRRTWRSATKHVVSTVNVFANGSADKVKSLHFDVLTRMPVAGATDAPANITVVRGKDVGVAVAHWVRGSLRHGFVVQYATDLGNPSTFSALIPSSKAKYTIDGLSPGQVVHVRVAAQDSTEKSGLGPWSAWVSGSAR